jgi:hypothetical protein
VGNAIARARLPSNWVRLLGILIAQLSREPVFIPDESSYFSQEAIRLLRERVHRCWRTIAISLIEAVVGSVQFSVHGLGGFFGHTATHKRSRTIFSTASSANSVAHTGTFLEEISPAQID